MREAVISLSDEELEELGYGELVTLCREAGIQGVEFLEDDGKSSVPQIEVEERLNEEVLDELEPVDDWELVREQRGTYLYILEITTPEMPESTVEDHEDLVGVCEPTMSDRGILLSLVGSQETIREMLRNFEDAGVTPDLRSLGEYEGKGRRVLDSLTDRQLEVLQTAYDMGFYDVPRDASTDEIAKELGVDAATVSEHLQRAERNLLSQQFVEA